MAEVHWPVELSHGPVGLRPLRSADGAEWTAVRQRNLGWLHPWDATQPPPAGMAPHPQPQSFRGMAREMNKQARQGRMLPFVITYEKAAEGRAKSPIVGQLTVSGITYGSARWASLGYWVDQAWAGRGIVPTAVALASDYCWFALGLHRVEVAIRPENTASLRVVQKLGFRAEGSRPAYLHIDGDWRDHLMFALTLEEVGPGLLHRIDPPPSAGLS